MTEPVGRSVRALSDDGADDAAVTPGADPAEGGADDSLPLGVLRLLDAHDPHTIARASYLIDRTGSELACSTLPCGGALRLAAFAKMDSGGVAERMMDHFLAGASDPVRVNLQAEIARNPQLAEYLAGHIETDMAERAAAGESVDDMNGSIWVPQSAYGPSSAGQDQRLALGGTYFEWQVAGSSADGRLQVRINVSDHYFWSPSEPRATQCLHQCGADLVARGEATEFYQFGEAHLVVTRPGQDEPIVPLDPEVDDDL